MNNETIHYIENAEVKVGVLSEIGGTIVFLSKHGSENILLSNPNLWNNKLEINDSTDFIPYNGHTIWVGPQSDWWKQQTVNQQKQQENAVWPPDPFITMGSYSVISKNEWSIKLQSQHSSVWGICLEKEIAVNPDGSVFIQVTLINSSNEPKSWDIWHNTRMYGFSKAYVKAESKNIRISPVLSNVSTEMPYKIVDGFFTYQPEKPPKEFLERSSKAFIYPEIPSIFGFTKNFMLTVSFEQHFKNQIHKEQGLVEIYNHTENDTNQAILELEYHSPYQKLMPGNVMQAWEVWTINDYFGNQTEQEHIQFIQNTIM